MGTIKLEDCCGICYEGTLVLKNEDLRADYYPICLNFTVILMVQVNLKYNFNSIYHVF